MSKTKDRQGTRKCSSCQIVSKVRQDDINQVVRHKKGEIIRVTGTDGKSYKLKAKKTIKEPHIRCPFCKSNCLMKSAYFPRPPFYDEKEDWEIVGVEDD